MTPERESALEELYEASLEAEVARGTRRWTVAEGRRRTALEAVKYLDETEEPADDTAAIRAFDYPTEGLGGT